MNEQKCDSLIVDFQATYLEQAELYLQGLSSKFIGQTFDLISSSDTIGLNSYPLHGPIKWEFEGGTHSFEILNPYIGGCFHDELIWEKSK